MLPNPAIQAVALRVQATYQSQITKLTQHLSSQVNDLKMRHQNQIANLTLQAKAVYLKNRNGLEAIKEDSIKTGRIKLGAPDFIWNSIYRSLGTWRGDRNYDGYCASYPKLTFSILSAVPVSERQAFIEDMIDHPDVRPNMYKRKAEFLAKNIGIMEQLIQDYGLKNGEKDLRDILFVLNGHQAKIAFLCQFKVIKNKYARNMMMDVYHPDFQDATLAIDSRIEGIGEKYKLPSLKDSDYYTLEAIYIDIAHSAGLTAWEFDRLMYNYHQQF